MPSSATPPLEGREDVSFAHLGAVRAFIAAEIE
jgi:hypothetical protein